MEFDKRHLYIGQFSGRFVFGSIVDSHSLNGVINDYFIFNPYRLTAGKGLPSLDKWLMIVGHFWAYNQNQNMLFV